MTWILMSMLLPMCFSINTWEIQDYIVREYTIERIDQQDNLIYAKGADLGVHWVNKNKTDCGGIYAGLWLHLWLRDKNLWKHLNSFKFYELWERYKDINKMRRWDIIFFESAITYHIATVVTPYNPDTQTVEILDWINTKYTRSPASRLIKIKYHNGRWWYHTSDKTFRLRFGTNIFVEEFKKQNKLFTWTIEYINATQNKLIDRNSSYINYVSYYNYMYWIKKSSYWLWGLKSFGFHI